MWDFVFNLLIIQKFVVSFPMLFNFRREKGKFPDSTEFQVSYIRSENNPCLFDQNSIECVRVCHKAQSTA
jgi:hypothetical protein